MSVLLILYNNNGAVICSDSRENSGPINFNNTIKVRYNESIIVGQIGLYSYNNIDYKKIITEELLKGKELNQILNGKYKNMNITLKESIPKDEMLTVFYAKKNGEIGVYDIKKNTELKNLATGTTGYYKNSGTSRNVFDSMIDCYLKFHENESVESLLKKAEYIIDGFIKLEEGYEKLTNTPSLVGGKVQFAYINFK